MLEVLTVHPRPDALFLSLQTALAGRYSLERELGRGGMAYSISLTRRKGSVGEGQRVTLVAEVAARRDGAQRRLGVVVGALESIRLGLLRLGVGAGTVESVTDELTMAHEIGEQTARLLQAAEEVRVLLIQEHDPP